jgi:putative aldouronate transport system substrate-binding protein
MNSTKEPQKVVDVLNFMLSDDFWEIVMYGVEGVAWEYDGAGNKIAIPDHGFAGGRAILRRNNAPGFFVGTDTPVDTRERVINLIGVCINQAIFSMDEGFRPAILDDPTFIDAEKERKTSISKIIVGDMPLADYDSVLDKWYQAGGQAYIEQMNEGIKANQ